jgi:hypothetical protein
VLLLNTGFEAVGRYAPIDIQDINISIGKEKSRAAAMVGVKHLESQWKNCRRFESKKKKRRNLSSMHRTKKRKIYN